MNRKAAAVAVIVGLTVVAAIALRASNRADASASDCYSSEQGPTTPTICE
jgi:uncharacterized membrane protein